MPNLSTNLKLEIVPATIPQLKMSFKIEFCSYKTNFSVSDFSCSSFFLVAIKVK